MARTKVYVLNSYRIDDWEKVGEETLVYHHKENAVNRLKCIKEQDFLPIVEKEDFTIHIDSPMHYEAGYDGDYSKGSVYARITETSIMDMCTNN